MKESSKILEKAWSALLTALNTGETLNVQAITTKNGFESLTSVISPTNDKNAYKLTFTNWGKNWSTSKVNYIVKTNTVELLDNRGNVIGQFCFIKTSKGWMLDNWVQI